MDYHIVDGVEQPGHVHPEAHDMGADAYANGADYADCPFEIASQPFSKKVWEEAWHNARKLAEGLATQ